MSVSDNYTDFFLKTFLFKEFERKALENILERTNIEVTEYKKNELICLFEANSRLGFVMSGECEISKAGPCGSIPINILKQFDSFGIATVFSNKKNYPTQIYAKKASKIAFISHDELLMIMNENPNVSLNIIQFLSDRVNFLNSKISTFSMSDCISKVASLLINEYERNNSKNFIFNCKVAAESLNIGRASLYRALHSLSEEGIIERENKKIIIKDPQGLKGISK